MATNSINALDRIALVLVIVGAINWGLIGFAQFDLVATLFGGPTVILSRLVYALVGIAGLYSIKLLVQRSGAVSTMSATKAY
jgi:uncharacterized membrane protein YuzA (DUF378 family)